MLVLVRRRGNAFDAVIQALKHASIPVAGADRLKLTEHIAIIDLMNLADALLLPQDDLALAVALKSPLLGLGDDDVQDRWQRRDRCARIDPRRGRRPAADARALDNANAALRKHRLRSMLGCSVATAAARESCAARTRGE
jgi:ATP-dependent helicase/nuclease subunit A